MAQSEKLKNQILQSPALEPFTHFCQVAPSLLVEELWESPKAALLWLLLESSHKQVLVISSGSEDRMVEDTSFFVPDHILEFPSWETLPGEEIAPSADLVGKRFEILSRLSNREQPCIVFASLQAVLQKLPPKKVLQPQCETWKRGEIYPFAELENRLTALGYRRAPVVSDKGEFAMRGGIIDLFPPASFDPYRLEFFGDTLEEIRRFDSVSQKSIEKVEQFFLSPASEVALMRASKSLSTLLDYLGENTLIVFNDLLALEDRYVELKGLLGSDSRYFLSFEEFLKTAQSYPKHFWTKERMEELSEVEITKKKGRAFYSGKEPLQPLKFQLLDHTFESQRWHHPFVPTSDFFSISENHASATSEEVLHSISRSANSALKLHFLTSSPAEEQSLKEQLRSANTKLPPSTQFTQGYLSAGFVLPDAQLALVPMTDLTHRQKPRRQKWRNTYHTPASEFHELSPGDVVVHFHNGIAKYLGIEKRPNHVGTLTEYMLLEYADNSRLFVPVSQSHLVSRYIGAKEEIPTLSQLGSNRWQKTRQQAQQAILGYADQLLRMNAERAVQGGFVYGSDSEEMQMFEEDFPFVETEDQLQAIAAIKEDMQSSKAMDRLICGDVGYGKTEVAMRAAFKAVVDGKKQVAVLVPTTILAMQHYETFCARMSNFPVNIGVISRFRPQGEIRETLKKAADGKIDILIGTHRIISKDVQFKELGLIIIDEEQRFGVRAKEHLKSLKTGVDCLTLSATPIPRTLYLSLMGSREISIINTPPQDRLPIKSILAERDATLIQNAFLRELSRDGQAFFIHNRVETIFKVTEELQKLLPQARIVTGHGQMSSDELDIVFHAFKSGEADILVSTTIIENGIDIPNANTILIDRADTFGMADLYQMRGRVGRWNRPAYAYFLVPTMRVLPEITRKRLHALVEAAGYGAGMKIAMRDLEIRGAGDILGTQQSGQISSIGFHLYCKMLKRAIDALKNKSAPSFTETKMEFNIDATLPEDYINESALRMEIYHRLGEASAFSEIDAIMVELKDRFGPYPRSVEWLYHLTRLRLFASTHHFLLLKFDTRTFLAERASGKESVKQTLILPKTDRPALFEKEVIASLKETYKI